MTDGLELEDGRREVSYRLSEDRAWMGLFIEDNIIFMLPVYCFNEFAKATNLANKIAKKSLNDETEEILNNIQVLLEKKK